MRPSGLHLLDTSLAYPFCPGCSHGLVADALGTALERYSADADRVALVSDIGCVGIVDRHFRVHTFHGLHGRSLTYATGLKLARPELRVFVVLGDGACGIGGHHLVQAARRGLPMTVLVFDNFNYGMTGGQHSTTTPAGAVTASTPFGAPDRPLDLCALATTAGATFVARAAATDPELPALIARAAEHPGFAIVDVWEFCTAHFAPSNHFGRAEMAALARANGMEFGVLREVTPPAPASHAPGPPRPAPALTPAFPALLDRRTEVVLAGAAGQKIRSAALAFGRAAVRSGLHATQKDDYPITVRSGHSVSELIVSPRPIRFTGITAPDAVVVLSPEGLARVREHIAALRPDGVLVADTALELPPTAARVVREDFAGAARRLGPANVALWALARLLAIRPVLAPEALGDAVATFTSREHRTAALRALV